MSAPSYHTPVERHLTSSEEVRVPMASRPQPKYPAGGTNLEEQRTRWERKRVRTVKELIETEQRYFEQLELVAVYFIEILTAKGTLRTEERDAIFCTFKSIHSINRMLLSDLENGKLGQGFERFCPQLHLYTTYTDNMEHALKVLQEQIKKNKQFARFKKLQESRAEFHGLKLEDLLPLPLRRIYQYKHLLRDLTENTNPDHPEFQQLKSAVRVISEASQHIQDQARRQENHLQVLRVQKLLKGRRSKVLAAGRQYIREGWLTAVPSKGEETKHRMFFLFSDLLLMTKPCHPLHPVHSDKLVWQRAYPLVEGRVEKVFGHTRSQGGLISLTFPEEKLLVMSNDQEDINNWYRCLSAAIGRLQSRATVTQRRDNLARRPLRPAQDSTQANTDSPIPKAGSKRYLSDQPREEPSASSYTENHCTEPKQMKLMPHPTLRPEDSGPSAQQAGNSCIIL
ncbi:rho guanine nucleotide exchange factor 39 [Leucoraja erinacea]|uniref:rho guanine nucleotide exchange factor 39 n=1 Tax=Leucoraja erinaceus TaxID=7782 RepID=UPI00245575D5|nr:rho guanine nucleotide exchange factor 39 [Leucoraja erinacea]XP_055508866.1 rho guanine nucleotide exchange factor 39 [Leucoraja erinacea]XP_055508867.1 rho guanine nucleotide exchange factor 39 [Leucoraja erinacea]XP_055508868.1 rho guanine nucleotide exchange factor 39 [Leucoraja erinacea]